MVVIPLAIVTGAFVSWLQTWRGNPGSLIGLLLIAAAGAIAALLVVAVRALTRAKTVADVELGEALALPVRAGSRRARTVAYEDVLSVDVYGKGRWARLVISTDRRIFAYPLRAFERPAAAVEQIRGEIRSHLAAARPDLLTAMELRQARGRSVMRRPSVGTAALIVAIGVVYAWQHFSGAFERPFALVGYGANAPLLVAQGEWHRLFAASFLHAGLLHVYLNTLGILFLGIAVEKLIGTWRLLLVFLFAALAGAVASAWSAPAALSVGASTGVFGLLGALALLNWRLREQLPGGFRQPVKWWIVVIGVNVALPFLIPMIDYMAHLGGFAAGALGGWLLSRAVDLDEFQPAGPAVKGAAAVLVLLFGFALLRALERAPGDPAEQLAVGAAFVSAPARRPSALNNIAWTYATLPDATPEELELAATAAARALSLANNAAVTDTVATVHFRQGRFDEAVATQVAAVELDDSRNYVLQLGRFLAARVRVAGPVERGGAAVGDIGMTILRANDGDGRVVVDLHRRLPDGATVYALLRSNGRLIGVVRADIGTGLAPGRYDFVAERPWLARRWPPLVEPEVVYVDRSGCACAPGVVAGRIVMMNRRVAELP